MTNLPEMRNVISALLGIKNQHYSKLFIYLFYLFHLLQLCRGSTTSRIQLLDLPVEALRLILRCFSDHRDIASIALVNRYLYKFTNEAGLWKSLSLYHLPSTKVSLERFLWRRVFQKRNNRIWKKMHSTLYFLLLKKNSILINLTRKPYSITLLKSWNFVCVLFNW